jgi:hypothetical protein
MAEFVKFGRVMAEFIKFGRNYYSVGGNWIIVQSKATKTERSKSQIRLERGRALHQVA